MCSHKKWRYMFSVYILCRYHWPKRATSFDSSWIYTTKMSLQMKIAQKWLKRRKKTLKRNHEKTCFRWINTMQLGISLSTEIKLNQPVRQPDLPFYTKNWSIDDVASECGDHSFNIYQAHNIFYVLKFNLHFTALQDSIRIITWWTFWLVCILIFGACSWIYSRSCWFVCDFCILFSHAM